jgi:hypothetical protein
LPAGSAAPCTPLAPATSIDTVARINFFAIRIPAPWVALFIQALRALTAE